MEPISLAIIGGIGWLGILARNYYTEMAAMAIERSRREQNNEQERVKREREQFDIVFQNLLTRVNEERETIQALFIELRIAINRSAEVDRQVVNELIEFRRALNYPDNKAWTGDERRTD